MKDISEEMSIQVQSGLGKKKWKKVVDNGTHTLTYIISTKLYNGDVKNPQYIAAT
jgi:hypothetical protein